MGFLKKCILTFDLESRGSLDEKIISSHFVLSLNIRSVEHRAGLCSTEDRSMAGCAHGSDVRYSQCRGKWKAWWNPTAPFVDVHASFTWLGSEPQVKQRVFELLSQHVNSFYNLF